MASEVINATLPGVGLGLSGGGGFGAHGNDLVARSKPRASSGAKSTPLFSDGEDDDGIETSDDDSGPDDAGSSPRKMISPVTSPPYWLHSQAAAAVGGAGNGNGNGNGHHSLLGLRTSTVGGGGHGRSVSNVSTESVVPVGAITLQDNEVADGDDRPDRAVGRERSRACWAKSVSVTDHVIVNGSATNIIGAFVVWNIRVETLSGSHMNIRKRYSEFDDLRQRLVFSFPNFEAAVPALPPKSVISKFRPRFLEKRRAGLQYFLNCILLNPEFSGSPVLKDFLFS